MMLSMQISREVTKEMIRDITKQLFHEVIDEMSSQMCSAAVRDRDRSLMLQTDCLHNELINELVSRFIRSVSLFHCFINHHSYQLLPGTIVVSRNVFGGTLNLAKLAQLVSRRCHH